MKTQCFVFFCSRSTVVFSHTPPLASSPLCSGPTRVSLPPVQVSCPFLSIVRFPSKRRTLDKPRVYKELRGTPLREEGNKFSPPNPHSHTNHPVYELAFPHSFDPLVRVESKGKKPTFVTRRRKERPKNVSEGDPEN